VAGLEARRRDLAAQLSLDDPDRRRP
jgi:hypothetical protein